MRKSIANVHRFGDTVGVRVDENDGTAYLSADAARKLAHALYRVARSIECEGFAQSECGTFIVYREDDGGCRTVYTGGKR